FHTNLNSTKISKLKYISTVIILLFVASACQDVIDVSLEEVDDQVVVDAWINTLPQDQTIKLQFSQGYFDNEFPRGISGATVTVVRNDGTTFIFNDSGNGNYVWESVNGETLGNPPASFTLNVENVDGKTLLSNTILRPSPRVDSITYEFRDDDLRGADGYYAQFFARDFIGQGDNYWIKTYKNGNYLNLPAELNIAFDGGFDGGANTDGLIFIPPIREFINPFDNDSIPPYAIGDNIRVEIHSISPEAFIFFEVVRDQITNGDNTIFALPLANAQSNVTNLTNEEQVLGMFNVAEISANEITVE
ncbi:MAG: DUF4249 domain-containing protein, partial [Bacteroidota bacterium]